jgi:hypothetical protein
VGRALPLSASCAAVNPPTTSVTGVVSELLSLDMGLTSRN